MGKIELKLDKYLNSKNITRYQLSESTGIRYETIDKYYKNKLKRYDSHILAKICDALQCKITDIIEYRK